VDIYPIIASLTELNTVLSEREFSLFYIHKKDGCVSIWYWCVKSDIHTLHRREEDRMKYFGE
jgi:hypothetical protein